MNSFSGSLDKDDKYTFRRTRKGKGGKTIMIKKADMSMLYGARTRRRPVDAMEEAVAFAQGVLADPELKKAYDKRARRKGTDAYHLAISEYNRGPGKKKTAKRR